MPRPTSPPITIATDATFATGPQAGQPTKDPALAASLAAQGYVPGSALIGRVANEWSNLLGQWATYVEEAASVQGAASQHLVETDANGRIAAQGGALANSAPSTILSVSGSPTAAGGADAAVNVTPSNSNVPGVRVSMSGSSTGPALLLNRANTGGSHLRFAGNASPSFPDTENGDVWINEAASSEQPFRARANGAFVAIPVWSAQKPFLEKRIKASGVNSSTSNSYVTIPGMGIGVAAVSGDVVRVSALVELSFSGGTGANVQLLIEGVAYCIRTPAPTALSGSTAGFGLAPCLLSATHAVSSTGSLTAALQWRRNSAAGTIYTAGAVMEVMIGSVL